MDFTSLVKELGIDKLPEDKQKTILTTLFRTMLKRVSLRMAQDMTDEQVTMFEKAVTMGDEASEAELEKVYPNFKQVCQEEIDAMKHELLGMTPNA